MNCRHRVWGWHDGGPEYRCTVHESTGWACENHHDEYHDASDCKYNKPKRIQRKRTKGWRMPENAVSICRPGKWGNPYIIGEANIDPFGMVHDVKDAAHAVKLFRRDLTHITLKVMPDFLEPLRGKDLACWCKEGEPCHGDVLLELANK